MKKKLQFLFYLSLCLASNSVMAMEGSGSADNPYLIATVNDLKEYCSSKTIKSHGKLVADIVLNENVLDENYQLNSGDFELWDKFAVLDASFDGNNHSISGLYINLADRYNSKFGLFKSISENAIVSNLTIKDAYLGCEEYKNMSSRYAGGLSAESEGTIYNCHFDGRIHSKLTDSGCYLGGLCGYTYGGRISNCSVKGEIYGDTYGVGFVGYNSQDSLILDHCTNYANLSAHGYTAGFVGYSEKYVKLNSCVNHGDIKSSGNYTAGLVASCRNGGKLDSCYNHGSIEAEGNYAAGILAYSDYKADFTSCANFGDIAANCGYAAGIVCRGGSTLSNCYNEGNISNINEYEYTYTSGIGNSVHRLNQCYNNADIQGVNNVSGLCSTTSYMEECYNKGNVIASGDHVAGLAIGIQEEEGVSYCYNIGAVTGKTLVSGIANYVSGSTLGCFNRGDITATDSLAAGICINNISYREIIACYNTGTIKAKKKIYGIANRCEVQHCYNAGFLIADSDIEPIVQKGGSITHSYYNKDICGDFGDEYGLSANEITDIKFIMRIFGSMAKPYKKVWCMNEDYGTKLYYPHIRHFSGSIEAPYMKEIEFDENGFCAEYPEKNQHAPIVDGVAQISNAGQLFWFTEMVNYDHKVSLNGELTNDIVIHENIEDYDYDSMCDTSYIKSSGYHMWVPLGDKHYSTDDVYNGTFDGNGHSISGIICPAIMPYAKKLNAPLKLPYSGFAAATDTAAVIKNLTIENSYFYPGNRTNYSGTFAGINKGLIQDCKVENCQLQANSGGVCGYNRGSIDSVEVISTTIYDKYLGSFTQNAGFAIYNFGTIKRSLFDGVVYSNYNAAGIVIENEGLIYGCRNNGAVYSNLDIAGICLRNQEIGTIENCVNTSNQISSVQSNIAAICKFNESYVDDYGKIINCVNLASFDSVYNFAGICDNNSGVISGCYNKGNITSTCNAAGIVRTNYGSVTSCCNMGNITGKSYVAGIAGSSNSSFGKVLISRCVNMGAISGTDDYVAGICAYAMNISNCCNIGSVSGVENVGGLAGWGTMVDSCYSVGKVTGTGKKVGCMVGNFTSSTASINGYVNSDSCMINPNGAESLTTASMLDSEAKVNMTKLDFDNIWSVIDGFFPLPYELKDFEQNITHIITRVDDETTRETKLVCFSNNGVVYIVTPEAAEVPVYNINGSIVRYITLHQGMNVVDDLENGIYILGDQKLAVR